MIRKIVGYDEWGQDIWEDVPPKVLLAVQDMSKVITLREAFPGTNPGLTAPGMYLAGDHYDMLVMCFEPASAAEQRWFHHTLLPRLAPTHQIVWTST